MTGAESLADSTVLNAPSSTDLRRQRLLRIGTSASIPSNAHIAAAAPSSPTDTPQASANESTSLRPDDLSAGRSYGTLPIPRRLFHKASLTFSRRRKNVPSLSLPRTAMSSPSSPTFTPSSFRDLTFSRLSAQRPISAYDAPIESKDDVDQGLNLDIKRNGIRVWYSSYSSIDWMHDAIKESLRYSRLRKRKSLRSHVRLALDRFLGWFIVTVVGVLTAVVAFLVVRGEQWLFDLKEGYCHDGWWKAKRFCCPQREGLLLLPDATTEAECSSWKPWSEAFFGRLGEKGEWAVEFGTYTIVALLLATASCMLTLVLTNSSSFVTRKESGVLAPDFPGVGKDGNDAAQPKRKISYYAAGSGIPELKAILSGFVIHGYLGFRVLVAKSVGLALSVASGLQLGKEGPFVHIASCIGNIVSRLVGKYENNEAKRREILSAACAAGVAVAFGAPIGGTLFSLEEVSYFFPAKVMWRSFFCAMIAAISLKLLNPFGTGKLVLFQVTYDKDWHAYEILPFIVLGVFGGVYGAYFSKLNFRWSRDVRNATWLKSHPLIEVMLVTLATSTFCFLNSYTRMGGTELVSALFSECEKGVEDEFGLCMTDPGSWSHVWPVVNALLLAGVVRGALTLVTFGIRLPAGIFIPSLAAGAIAGRIVGILFQYLHYQSPDSRFFSACGGDLDCIIPGLYAMVGAAASLAGVTRTTVSLAVIMFELTDTLSYTIPVMVAVLCAKTTADALEEKGIYDLVIDLAQLPYLDAKKTYLWGDYEITDVVARDVDVINVDKENTVESLRDQLQELVSVSGNDDASFPIVRTSGLEEETKLVGVIGARELEHALFIVADHPDEAVTFSATSSHQQLASSSISSLLEDAHRSSADVFDFSVYMDQGPLTINSNSPLELVQQLFVKLGARYVIVADSNGNYEGMIDKKTWLAFLSELEETA